MAKSKAGRPRSSTGLATVPQPGLAYLPFDVLSEPWSKFKLQDGTNLRLRFILLKMRAAPPVQAAGLNSASISSQLLTVVEPRGENRGTPGPILLPEEILRHIDKEVGFESVEVAPSVYRFEKDRTLVVTTNPVKVRRTTLFGPDGDRIYQIETGSQVAVLGGPSPGQS